MTHNAPDSRTPSERRGHELFDLDVSYIGWFSLGLVILLIATAGVAFFMLGGWRVSNAVIAKQSTAGSVSGPFATLQDTPQDDLRDYRRSKAAALESYRWVDRRAGVVAIPIGRAMELVAAEAGTHTPVPPITPTAKSEPQLRGRTP